MNTIYLVWQSASGEDNDVLGAFSTEELAKEYLESIYRERYEEEFDGMMGNPTEGAAMISPDSIDVDQIDEYFKQFDATCWVTDTELDRKP